MIQFEKNKREHVRWLILLTLGLSTSGSLYLQALLMLLSL